MPATVITLKKENDIWHKKYIYTVRNIAILQYNMCNSKYVCQDTIRAFIYFLKRNTTRKLRLKRYMPSVSAIIKYIITYNEDNK